MAASVPHDLWLCYRHCMDLHGRMQDPHARTLMLADARACLDLWFEAVERELTAERTAPANAGRQELSPT